MAELIAEHTGQTVERIIADSDRDRWFTARRRCEYGFVDYVLTRANSLPDASQLSSRSPDESPARRRYAPRPHAP